MTGLRRAEVICGVLSGVLGLATLGVVFFAPLQTRGGGELCTTTPGSPAQCVPYGHIEHISIVQNQGLYSVLGTLILFGAVFVAVAAGAVLNGWRGAPGGLTLLWLATTALGVGTLLAALSIGLFLMPSLALGACASLLGGIGLLERQNWAPVPGYRWAEFACGAIAGLMGVLGLMLAYFFPREPYVNGGGYASLAINEGPGNILPELLGFLALLVVVALASTRHALTGGRNSRPLLWLATALLAASALLTLPRAGVFLLPCVGFALLAVGLSLIRGPVQQAPAN